MRNSAVCFTWRIIAVQGFFQQRTRRRRHEVHGRGQHMGLCIAVDLTPEAGQKGLIGARVTHPGQGEERGEAGLRQVIFQSILQGIG